jgi:hypothetical protein
VFIAFALVQQLFQFFNAFHQINQFHRLDRVLKDAQSRPDFTAGLATAKVPLQGVHCLVGDLLQPADGSFDDLAACLPVSDLELGQVKPTVQGGLAYARLGRGRRVARFGQQGRDQGLLFAARLPLFAHWLSLALTAFA